MESAFGVVLFVVVVVAALIAVASLLFNRGAYDDIGRGAFSLDRERRTGGADGGGRAETAAEREAEIRQLLDARNARRRARGEAPVDVEAELQRLTGAQRHRDPELLEEVRALVRVRNERRRRRGEPPLDVDAEVERQLRELGA